MGITERLGEVSEKLSTIQSNGINVTDEHIQAVDDGIEEIERLREALEEIENSSACDFDSVRQIARTALEGEQHESSTCG